MAMAMQTVLDDLGKGLGLYVLAEMIAAWGRCVLSGGEGRTCMLSKQVLCGRPLVSGTAQCCQKTCNLTGPHLNLDIRVHAADTASSSTMLACSARAGALHPGAANREKAFNVAVSAWLPCGLIFACAALTLGRDEDAMQVLL